MVKIQVISLMRKGVVYVDGAHVKIPFEYGATLSADGTVSKTWKCGYCDFQKLCASQP